MNEAGSYNKGDQVMRRRDNAMGVVTSVRGRWVKVDWLDANGFAVQAVYGKYSIHNYVMYIPDGTIKLLGTGIGKFKRYVYKAPPVEPVIGHQLAFKLESGC